MSHEGPVHGARQSHRDDPYYKGIEVLFPAQISANPTVPKGLTEELMTKKFWGIAATSHFFVINFSVNRILSMDTATLGIACGERKRENSSPPNL